MFFLSMMLQDVPPIPTDAFSVGDAWIYALFLAAIVGLLSVVGYLYADNKSSNEKFIQKFETLTKDQNAEREASRLKLRNDLTLIYDGQISILKDQLDDLRSQKTSLIDLSRHVEKLLSDIESKELSNTETFNTINRKLDRIIQG